VAEVDAGTVCQAETLAGTAIASLPLGCRVRDAFGRHFLCGADPSLLRDMVIFALFTATQQRTMAVIASSAQTCCLRDLRR
jgi:hypothetical protein